MINLKGYRTKISGWIMAAAPLAAMLGYQYEPDAVSGFLRDAENWIVGGYLIGGAAVHWFRNLANK